MPRIARPQNPILNSALRSTLYLLYLSYLALTAMGAAPALAVTPPSGYVYDALAVGSLTASCLAVGPGGTFVGIGPAFTPNAQAIALARESGDHRLVAFGFSSIADCAYDPSNDVLYVTDNGLESGAVTGDTVFAIPSASTAAGLTAAGLELLPAGTLPSAGSIAVDGAGDVLVGNASGADTGDVTRIDVDSGPTSSVFAAAFDFTGGIAIDRDTGDVLVAETLEPCPPPTFQCSGTLIRRFTSAGTELPAFLDATQDVGSLDLAFDVGGNLLATGLFFGDVVSLDATATATPFVSDLVGASGVSVNDFTGRVEIASGFSFTDDDVVIHRFVPVDRLARGTGSLKTECLHEFYGIDLVASAPGGKAKKALCADGAPCDADGQANDRCVFPIGFCFNVDDPALSACAPTSPIAEMATTTRPFSEAVASLDEEVQAELTSAPIDAATCFFSDGFTVPVKKTKTGKKTGKARVKVQVTTLDGSKDSDTAILQCSPAP